MSKVENLNRSSDDLLEEMDSSDFTDNHHHDQTSSYLNDTTNQWRRSSPIVACHIDSPGFYPNNENQQATTTTNSRPLKAKINFGDISDLIN